MIIVYCLLIVFANSIVLQFNANRKFKILQFTDLHFGEEDIADLSTVANMLNMVRHTKPDLVVITGDLISNYGKAKNFSSIRYLSQINSVFEQTKTPYFFTFGNHDHNLDITSNQYLDFAATLPYCLNEQNPPGHTNFYKPIYYNNSVVHTLWAFDGTSGTAWGHLQPEQIQYITDSLELVTRLYPGVEGIGFKHVPTKQFIEIQKLKQTHGYRGQDVCCATESPNVFDIFSRYKILTALFVGHDHKSTYRGHYNGILLCYGVKTGTGGYASLENEGGRILELELKSDNKVDMVITKIDKYLNQTYELESIVQPQTKKTCDGDSASVKIEIVAAVSVLAILILLINSKLKR